MTTPKATAKTSQAPGHFRFPDPPEHPPDKMTNFNKMSRTGNVYLLADRLGNPETTLVAGEHYLSPEFTRDMAGLRYPDLLVAFGVNPAAYKASNAYVISEQGKPPDFVLEIASPGTWREDAGPKRNDYAAIGVGEYWRFDETGRYGGRLHGERLVNGEYVAIDVEELTDGSLQGYSSALDLNLRWERGELVFYAPATGRPIATLADEREARIQAEARAENAEARADTAEVEHSREREARAAAEARVRELEELLRQRNL